MNSNNDLNIDSSPLSKNNGWTSGPLQHAPAKQTEEQRENIENNFKKIFDNAKQNAERINNEVKRNNLKNQLEEDPYRSNPFAFDKAVKKQEEEEKKRQLEADQTQQQQQSNGNNTNTNGNNTNKVSLYNTVYGTKPNSEKKSTSSPNKNSIPEEIPGKTHYKLENKNPVENRYYTYSYIDNNNRKHELLYNPTTGSTKYPNTRKVITKKGNEITWDNKNNNNNNNDDDDDDNNNKEEENYNFNF